MHMQYYKATSILFKFRSSHFPSSLFLLHKYCCSEPQWNRHLYARPLLLSDHCSKHTWGCDSRKILQNRMKHSRILRFFRLSLQHKSPTHTRVWESFATFSGLFKHLNLSHSNERQREDKARPPRFVGLLLLCTLIFNQTWESSASFHNTNPLTKADSSITDLWCAQRDGGCQLLGIPNKHAVNTSNENLVWQQAYAARISSERMNPVPGYLCV